MKVVNQIRILGEELGDRRVVEKVLISLPEKFEAKISFLEESRDLNQISLSELVNALQATEQRRSIRQEEALESAFLALQKGKAPTNNNQRKQQGGGSNDEGRYDVGTNREGERKKFVKCSHCKKDNHSEKYCWFRPNVQCRACRQLRHIKKVCKNKGGPMQQAHQVQVANEAWQSEERLFVATCYAENSSKEAWLVDSCCTQHMTHDADLFKCLDRSFVSKVRIGNGDFIQVQGNGDVVVETSTDKSCTIYDQHRSEILNVGMKDKSFEVEWNWKKSEVQASEENFIPEHDEIQEEADSDDENVIGIRGTRSLSDVYDRGIRSSRPLSDVYERSI
ncbi:uncharacterized protein LOC132804054 [Ziziphus jujuba]|uniref:Uncharacterized protein LOC132804054 n=1 Tax=Ziziphus jujuba TaxID=326968 RepID=A0ABM4AB24_ZIZJJ|nr:uncharacterized protein LOC132804054 [Ziziphus jujuba]